MGGGGQQLRGTVADDHLLGGDAVLGGQLAAQLGGVRVAVAVQPAARDVGHRVDDRRGRQLGPRRLREVDRVDVGQRPLAALGRLAAQLEVDLLLGEPLELPVVVQQAHQMVGSVAAVPGWPRIADAARRGQPGAGVPGPAIYCCFGARLGPSPPMNSSQKVKQIAPIAAVVAKIGPMIPLRWS